MTRIFPSNHGRWVIGFLLLAVAPLVQARDFLWAETNCIVSMDLPPGWTTVGKAYGEQAYTWLINPRSGKRAEMFLTLTQNPSRADETEKDLEARLGTGVIKTFRAGQGYSVMKFPMRHGMARMSQFTRDELRFGLPIAINHPVLRLVYCTLDAHSGAVAMMQMDDPNSPEAAAMADIVSSLSLTRRGPSTFLDVIAMHGRYVLSVPAGRLQLNIPKGGLVHLEGSLGGATSSPRYFSFVDAKRALQVSGWFENARSYKGIKDFWTSENAGDRLNAKHVSFEKIGDWDVVYYETLDGVAPAIRAEYVREDTWIDLHCSISGDPDKSKVKKDLLDFVRSLSVETKEPVPAGPPPPKLDGQHLAELKSALTDLTANIEQTDDKRFAEAIEAMTLALSGLNPARFDYTPDCMVWNPPPRDATMTYGYLTIAFVSAIAQERIFGEPQLALYRGWKNVIKYYQHYHSEGGLPKIASVEKLIADEKSGVLQEEARKTQALHPAQFDRLEL